MKPVEVKIPVPWGHIAGKWWGRKDVRPILGIHGWQDNCGTFDTIAPLLPKHIGFLAIDLPGHGLSSRIPDGSLYYNFDYVILIRMICKKYKWDKISLLGHSLGGVMSFLYAATHPEDIDMFIAIDGFKPNTSTPSETLDALSKDIESALVADERNRSKSEPPSYTIDELIERAHLGSRRSIAKETAHHIIVRGVARSKLNPDKFFFTRDARLKSNIPTSATLETSLEMVKNFKFPYVAIQATKSSFSNLGKDLDAFFGHLKENNQFFEHHMINGTHHVHLNEPEKVIDIINNFINKYRPSNDEAEIKSKL